MDIIIKLQQYSPYIIGFLIILCTIFLKSYVQEKGKLKALKSENEKLIEETEKIKSRYSRQLEEVKKEHQLDITKRKSQYESKRDEYINFFQLIDSFNKENNEKIQSKLLPILQKFYEEYLSTENPENKNTAVTNMTLEMQKIIMEANVDIIKVKQQTNSIKLIGSLLVREKINELSDAFDSAMEKSNKMMENLPTHMLTNNQSGMKEDEVILQNSGNYVKTKTEELIELMRKELDEI